MTRHPRNERGAVLVVVLALTALLAAIAAEIALLARVEGERAAAAQETMRARLAAESATTLAFRILEDDDPEIDSTRDEWAKPIAVSVEGAEAEARIVDECALFPLNRIIGDNGLLDIGWKTRLERLALLARWKPELTDAVVDFMDQDDLPFPEGAESEHYGRLVPPRRAPNRRVRSLHELALVRGLDETRSRELAVLFSPVPFLRINLNTADAPVIAALLPGARLEDAWRIVARRDFAPFRSVGDVGDVLALDDRTRAELETAADVASSLFRITATGRSGRTTVVQVAIVERQPQGFVIKYRQVL